MDVKKVTNPDGHINGGEFWKNIAVDIDNIILLCYNK